MAGRPTTSLLVSTYNWPAALELVLESTLGQRDLPDELLVADDGSGDETRAVVDAFAARFTGRGVPLVHVWQEDRGFRKSRILNRSLARARGEYVLMIDGDCVLHPEFVGTHLRFARPGSFVQGTRVLLSRERAAAALEHRETRFGILDRGLGNRANALSLPLLSPLVPTPRDPLRGARGCNMAYWRADAVRINGFNEAFVGWGREDSEFTARMLAGGVRRRKLKFAGIVYHLWHEERSREALVENHELYERVVASGVARCEQGLDQYLGKTTVEVGDGVMGDG